jgi:hypothetical protein
VKTGHPVRNHEVSILFVVPGTKNLEKKVLIPGSWITRDLKSRDGVNTIPGSWNSISEPGF